MRICLLNLKNSIMYEFGMRFLKMRYFLGMEVMQRPKSIFICQMRYLQESIQN
jgi:hypothetical protein